MPQSSSAPLLTKSISAARDHRQSRGLVLVFAAALVLAFPYHSLVYAGPWLPLALGVSLTFALLVWVLRAATPGGALAGGAICFAVTFRTGPGPLGGAAIGLIHSALLPLMTLFLLTFAATKLGKRRKEQAGLAESRRGRTAAQVIANLGVAGLLSALTPPSNALHTAGITMLLAALAEATADTVASEIGQAFGGTPRLLPSLRPVPAGTDGAVSLVGTAAGLVAAALLMLSSAWCVPSFPLLALGWAGGVAGLFFDTLLGATVERKGWLGNDLVNFASTAFAALFAFVVYLLFRAIREL